MNLNIEHDLLTPAHWPSAIAASSNFNILQRAARLATTLDDVEGGDADIDAELHALFTRFSRLLPWMPDPQLGHQAYTRHVWDLRALQAMVPAYFQLEVKQVTGEDKDGSARWRAALYDPGNAQNLVLHDHSDIFGSAWSPNLALARLLIAGSIAGVIQKIMQTDTPSAAARHAA
jgi:hypothetical protein